MSGAHVREALLRDREEPLAAAERQTVDAHAPDCAECAALQASLVRNDRLLATRESPLPLPARRQNSRPRRWRMPVAPAAALVFVTLIALVAGVALGNWRTNVASPSGSPRVTGPDFAIPSTALRVSVPRGWTAGASSGNGFRTVPLAYVGNAPVPAAALFPSGSGLPNNRDLTGVPPSAVFLTFEALEMPPDVAITAQDLEASFPLDWSKAQDLRVEGGFQVRGLFLKSYGARLTIAAFIGSQASASDLALIATIVASVQQLVPTRMGEEIAGYTAVARVSDLQIGQPIAMALPFAGNAPVFVVRGRRHVFVHAETAYSFYAALQPCRVRFDMPTNQFVCDRDGARWSVFGLSQSDHAYDLAQYDSFVKGDFVVAAGGLSGGAIQTTDDAERAPSPSQSAGASLGPTPTPSPIAAPTASPTLIPLPSIAQLNAPSANVVWALVAGTRLFRSSDRGDTWVERTIPPGLGNVEVSFADDTNGLLLSPGSPAGPCQTQTASIWKTADGAASWQQVTATGIADAMCKRGLASADTAHAFFTAYGPNSGPVIYRTADGGRTWTASKPLPDPPGFTFTTQGGVVILPGRPRAFGSVVLIDAQAYGEHTRYVFRSTDGGATFTYTSTVPTVESIAYVTAVRWLQIAAPGDSTETTDAGVTWHAFASDYAQAAPIAPAIVFGDAQVGYATVRGAIERTIDGGVHWSGWSAIRTPGTF